MIKRTKGLSEPQYVCPRRKLPCKLFVRWVYALRCGSIGRALRCRASEDLTRRTASLGGATSAFGGCLRLQVGVCGSRCERAVVTVRRRGVSDGYRTLASDRETTRPRLETDDGSSHA